MPRNPNADLAASTDGRSLADPLDFALSVIIVSWNTRDILQHSLQSLHRGAVDSLKAPMALRSGAFTGEIIVVDNNSHDQTVDMVHREFPAVKIIANDDNLGFARACNQGIRSSHSPYVLLLNPDTVVQGGAIDALIAFMDAHPKVGAAGARLVDADGTLQPSCHPAPTLSRELWRLLHLDALHPYSSYPMNRWALDRPRHVDAVQGACLLLRRSALHEVGLLDEDYFIYSEEVDLCQRLREHGWRIAWVPQAVVVHHGGLSTRQVASAMFLRLYGGKVLYFRKRHGLASARIYKIILCAVVVPRMLLSPLALLQPPDRRRESLALAARYWGLVKAMPWL